MSNEWTELLGLKNDFPKNCQVKLTEDVDYGDILLLKGTVGLVVDYDIEASMVEVSIHNSGNYNFYSCDIERYFESQVC